MLEHLWISGIITAFSIFGIKVGLGLGSRIYSQGISNLKKAGLTAATLIVYLILFFSLYYVISSFNLLNHLDKLVDMLKYGMLLHMMVAFGLVFWGMKLLLGKGEEEKSLPLRASLLLILPCPVCAVVILLNLTLACSLFTCPPLWTTLLLFALFGGIVIITTASIFPFRHRAGAGAGNTFLGVSMCLISLYFLLTVIIAPLYPEIEAAFAMAASNTPPGLENPFHAAVAALFALAVGGGGVIKNLFFAGVCK